jgi:hypothetical protein
MDAFGAIVAIGFLLMFLVFMALGWAWRGRPAADITDKARHEEWAAQLKIEQLDIPQMLSAANDYRRKRGRKQVTLDEFQAIVEDEQMSILDDANKQLAASANTGDGSRERRGF